MYRHAICCSTVVGHMRRKNSMWVVGIIIFSSTPNICTQCSLVNFFYSEIKRSNQFWFFFCFVSNEFDRFDRIPHLKPKSARAHVILIEYRVRKIMRVNTRSLFVSLLLLKRPSEIKSERNRFVGR